MRRDVLGVHIDSVTIEEALNRAQGFLEGNSGNTIFTPNPEMLVEAQNNPVFREILNTASLNLCDGVGIQLLLGGKIKRIPGVDFVYKLCALAEKRGDSLYLLGTGSNSILEKTVEELTKKFPNLHIVGYHRGVDITLKNGFHILDEKENDKLIDNIISVAPKILLVAFGHSKQEQWIYTFLSELPSVRIAVGVGGSFDYISGEVSRAPKILRVIGLEWLYRLLLQPKKRFKRIINAVIIFPFTFLFKK
ncbi:MAG: hypothetical protein COV59_02955 [Candidatus Magasanikbacteria bacterium CG11_big_fil_rev_8_21_14_0_20_39_34]|uniref:Glycosyltransferase n=1 Tax=Candidatus Magasanikbacteria bacterium CG11_big_fil_rev_8_21_14_0_20_39_34 TaxID=1974653 RepID=A0A2H0N5G0_9BACT|nr:MAG: hypothetical protein COV59_02955 [Candidatus Magasanikbacteria bacterium CG11_big_fil_rev_8_21_14_0_20_39_34]